MPPPHRHVDRPSHPTDVEAQTHLWTPKQLAIAEQNRHRAIVGAPEQVRERLLALAADYEAEELVVVTIAEDEASRLRSYELLAEIMGLRLS